ncbi:1-hydroxycarotenoid 3,4-desaturase CrtD [Planktotalea sp.]|uniref:1-hydroxycarotenoid 3,4-desaturase CrtD n=1 Tax=Planktotalea sp. TaxID=2029877 RepID=UPI0025DB2C26|nr:1-hydroxycarotenoid 3,4-desaturase CrtD [Planktotalea sp.]
MPLKPLHVAIVGAGIGGLAAALRLAFQGVKVTVFEQHGTAGGKMRIVPSDAGPIDAGPTVLTIKPVFETLFSDVGLCLEDHLTLIPQDILARHFWPDGTTLDLMQDPEVSRANVQAAFGTKAARDFDSFSNRARQLYDAFDAPMMQSSEPSQADLTRLVLKNPKLIPAMDPLRSLSRSLNRKFSEPRLAQLFARYATYVGGVPDASPALLSLIWNAENQGVWHVKGGMHQLALSIASCAKKFGAAFQYGAKVTRVEMKSDAVCAVHTEAARIPVDAVLFNGDPAALQCGLLSSAVIPAVPMQDPRSLSASVMSFAAKPDGIPLSAHNVFFADDPKREYAPLAKGQHQTDPTLYICAQDRFAGSAPVGLERFEIILNSPPIDPADPQVPAQLEKARQQCQTQILDRLKHFGLTFSPTPQPSAVTLPQDFNRMFPASGGSLYGRSPHGMMAAFKRPTARTAVTGLYLTGGGSHPGAGVPMATLSATHAVAAILSDLTSI